MDDTSKTILSLQTDGWFEIKDGNAMLCLEWAGIVYETPMIRRGPVGFPKEEKPEVRR